MKVASIVGARPQFIKAAPVGKVLREAGHEEILIHTGQHYDYGMSQVFFDELEIPAPKVNLGVGSGTHARQTGEMLIAIEEVLLSERPDYVLVYGDTNSTLAGALAAAKLRLSLAHVEAGLRSFNREMPEEHNRVLTDHCSDLLLCPAQTAVGNLSREGITEGVHLVGDPMYDAVLQFARPARQRSTILEDLSLQPGKYVLATVHRPYNTDVLDNFRNILTALTRLDEPVIFPVHPRTRRRINELWQQPFDILSNGLQLTDPVSYLDMLVLEENARVILTDSGGIQKEALFFGVPCVTLRPETEWIETVEAGWNVVTGTDPERILEAAQKLDWPLGPPPTIYGAGDAAIRIALILEGQPVSAPRLKSISSLPGGAF